MTDMKKIPERSQIPVEDTWDLSAIYPSDQAWEQDLEDTRALARKLPGYAGRLGESATPSMSSWSWSSGWGSTSPS